MVSVYLPTYLLFVEHDIRIIYFIFAKYHERVIVNIKGNQSPKRYGEQYRFSDKAKESLSFAKAFVSNSFLYIFPSELQIYEVLRAELAIGEQREHD